MEKYKLSFHQLDPVRNYSTLCAQFSSDLNALEKYLCYEFDFGKTWWTIFNQC